MRKTRRMQFSDIEQFEEIQDEERTREAVADFIGLRRGSRPSDEEVDRLKKLIDILLLDQKQKLEQGSKKDD
jgi:hypothetical protein